MRRPKTPLGVRVATALALVLILIGTLVFFGTTGLLVFFGAFLVLASLEYSLMSFNDLRHSFSLRASFVVVTAALLILSLIFDRLPILVFAAVASLLMSVFLWWVRSEDSNDKQLRTLSQLCIGLIYLGVFPGLGLRLLKYEATQQWFWYLIAVVSLGDIAAYFSGRAFGKRPLLKSVSPNKTLEGFLGAVVCAVVVSCIFQVYFVPQAPIWLMALVGILVSFTAQTGDLFESLIKRVAGVKDSGKLLPGHGGLLDRVDGHIFASPIVYFAQVYFLDRFY